MVMFSVNGEPKWNEDRCHFDDEVYITDVNQSLESADIMDTLDKDSVCVHKLYFTCTLSFVMIKIVSSAKFCLFILFKDI